MDISRREPIHTCTRSAPRHRLKVGLEVVEEKIPGIPYVRKMVTPQGNVTRLPLATGKTIGPGHTNIYSRQKWDDKLAKGFLPYSECPVAKGYIQMPGETPCNPTEYWEPHPTHSFARIEDECCKHIEEAIRVRRETHNKQQAEYAALHKRSEDKMIEAVQALTDVQKPTEARAEPVVGRSRGRPPGKRVSS